jgi:DNA polymerase-1
LERDLSNADTIVGFNLKYDLHVLRKWGVRKECFRKVFCTQVAQFILDRQSHSYPSLEGTAATYGIGAKLNKVAEYWAKGVQTSEIPRDELAEYVLQDVRLTHQIYLKQQQLIKPSQAALIRLAMLDLLCLEDIEWNGLKYDRSGIEEQSKQIDAEILNIQTQLNLHHSVPNFNWNSSDHLSSLLFGGTIVQEVKVPAGHYKTGAKAGEVKYKKEIVEHHLPRMFKPLKKTEGGKLSTDEDVLIQLGDSDLIKNILRIKALQKLNSTYFKGFLEKADKAFFEPDYIHANFNQVVTRTGRLSSSKPNLQNTPEELDAHFISRWGAVS